jgi:O-antigen/teichoic acid export membrane protein
VASPNSDAEAGALINPARQRLHRPEATRDQMGYRAERGPIHEGHGRNRRTLFQQVSGDILRISGAVGLAQVLVFVLGPLITRQYSPEAFGHFAFFGAMVTILVPLASLRYEWALPLPADDSSALDLLALCVVVVVAFSLAVASLALLLWPIVVAWTNIGTTEMMLLPLAVFTVGLHAVATGWLARRRAFSQLARIRFITMVGAAVCQIALGVIAAGPTSLILGFVCGYVLGLALAVYQCRRALLTSAARLHPRRMRRVAAEYRAFAAITAPSGVVNAVGSQLPSMILPSLYGLAITGQYSLAQRALGQPTVFVGQAVNQVFWSNAARLVADEPASLWPLFLRLNLLLATVMAPGFVLIWFGPEIFSFVFGAAWRQAGGFAGVLFVASFLGLIAQGTTSLHVYRLNHWMCAWEFLNLVLVISALSAAVQLSVSPMTCIIALTAALVTAHGLLLGLNVRAIRRITSQSRAGGSVGAGINSISRG